MDDVAAHYGNEGLAGRILGALEEQGHDVDRLDPDVLSGADEFHLGGRVLTEIVLEDLAGVSGPVLDIGCGIGGPARMAARRLGVPVTGLDLTPEFVAAAEELTARCGLADNVRFEVGSALAMPFDDDAFAGALMFHVGMNIEDKAALFTEVARVLRPGGVFAVYDTMRVGDGELTFPLPWATDPSTSFVAQPGEYVAALEGAGFAVGPPTSRAAEAAEATASGALGGPVTLGHTMGERFGEMIGNLRPAVAAGILAPTQLLATL